MSRIRLFLFGAFILLISTAEKKPTIGQKGLMKLDEKSVVSDQTSVKSASTVIGVKEKAICQTTIYANDRMQYTDAQGARLETMLVPNMCQEFVVFMEYKGSLPSTVMGHNWILTEDKHIQELSSEAIKQGVAKGYLPLSDDSRVIAASSRILGGGTNDHHKDKIVVDMKKIQRDKTYTYWCSFPGHISMMRGGFQVQEGATISVSDQTKATKG